jgi:CDP-glucose 4,6-dehydratase
VEVVDLNRDFWRGRRVLVTGHTGFKGSWCTVWLHELGAETLGFALPPATTPSLYELASVANLTESVFGDIRDRAQLKAVVTRFKPEVILHFAAQSLVRMSYREPFETYETNVLGTASVLEAARATPGIRAVLIVTSDKCYENQGWQRGYKETDPLGGRDPYSSSKACAELVTAAYRASFFAGELGSGPGIATVRAGNVIGGGDWAADRLLPDLFRAFGEKRSALIRNPASTRPWQHVLDPLNGYLGLAQRLVEDSSLGTAWNFGPPVEAIATVQEVADEICRLWGDGARWHHTPTEQPHEARELAVDAGKAQAELGWKPRLGLRQSLEWAVEWQKAIARGENARTLTERQIARFQELV